MADSSLLRAIVMPTRAMVVLPLLVTAYTRATPRSSMIFRQTWTRSCWNWLSPSHGPSRCSHSARIASRRSGRGDLGSSSP